MKLNILMFMILCLANTQEQWDIIYQSFQDTNTMDASGWIVSNNYFGKSFYTCDGIRLFGGYNVFGTNTILSKLFSLPPHYQVEVTLELWKIHYPSYEVVIIVDGITLDSKSYELWIDQAYVQYLEQSKDCHTYSYSNGMDSEVQQITIRMNHNSESLTYIMTSDTPYFSDYWGIRDFTLSIVRCPSGCLYCSDNDYNNCYQWIGVLSLWHESIKLDGWVKNDNIQPATSKCVSFDLVGGYLNLRSNDKLEKIIQNLSPHYKISINFQIWQIDRWQSKYEFFQLLVDDQIQNQTNKRSADFNLMCGSTRLEKTFNSAITLSHQSSQCKITMTNNVNGSIASDFWGIRAFNIYIAKCYSGCDECLGPLKTQCTVCSSGWVLFKNLCTQSPPILLSQIQTIQIKDPQSDDRIPIEINLLEVDQQINTQGNFTLSVKNKFKFLTIQVNVKCLPKVRIKSLFQSNKLQDSYLYSFFLNCQQAFNTVIYNVKYEQRIITEQEIIVNISDKQCVIYQVIKVIDELPFFIKILEIIIEDF